MRGEQLVQVREHVLDRLRHLGMVARHRLAHSGELRVQHLALQQLLDLLVHLARGVRAPLVLRQLPHRPRGVGGHRVQVHLLQPRVVGRVARELVLLGRDRLVEQLAYAVQRPGEVTATPQLLAPLPRAVEQRVEPATAVRSAAQQVAQRLAQRAAREHVATQLVQRLADVVRRCQRIGPVVPRPVPEPTGRHHAAP
jgi:hypothetical protein